MPYREIVNHDGTPIQQAMTQDPDEYRDIYHLTRMMLGVIIEVYPSDNEDGNRTSIQTNDRLGFTHECDVLVVDDGQSSNLFLSNVVITPDAVSGLDDYYERLPRGSSKLVTGDDFDAALHQIDPYELDGDWCVVGFIGGRLDQPFVVRWWPHAANRLDPATSGTGAPDSGGNPKALEQERRYFRRINGVETTVTSKGDIILSTTFAGSKLNPGADPRRGRLPRTETDGGGSIRLYMKPKSTMEWVWDDQVDFVGALDAREDETPQENPPRGSRVAPSDSERTYIVADAERVRVEVPTSFKVFSEEDVSINAKNETNITGDNKVRIESSLGTIELDGKTVVDLVSQAIMNLTAEGAITVSAGGALTLGGSSVSIGPAASGESPSGPGAITGDETEGITLGEGGEDFLVKGTSLNSAWQPISTTLTAVPDASDPSSVITLANANKTAILGIISALTSALSEKTKTI